MDDMRVRRAVCLLSYISVPAAMCVQIYTCFMRRINTDAYFLINNGYHIVKDKNLFPRIAFSTIHEGLDIVIQQPLYDVIIYLTYLWFGTSGIMLLCCICMLLFILLVYLLVKPSVNDGQLRLLYMASALTFMPYAFYGRPFMATSLIMLLSLNILERVKDNRISDNYLLALIPFSLTGMLLHASFYPVILLLYACYLAPKNNVLLSRDVRYKIKLSLVILCSFTVSFMTPYRTKLPLYLFYSYGSANSLNISELKAPAIFSVCGLYIFLMAALLIFMTRKADGIHYLLVFFGFCFLILHQRNFMLATIFVLPLFKDLLIYLEDSFLARGSGIKSNKWLCIYTAGSAIVFFVIMTAAIIAFPSYAVKDSAYTPVKAAAYLNDIDEPVLFTGFNNGAFFEFMGYDSYMDARPEVYSKILCGKDILSEYISLRKDSDFDYSDFIGRYGFDYLLAEKGTLFYTYLKSCGDYDIVVDGKGYSLFKPFGD